MFHRSDVIIKSTKNNDMLNEEINKHLNKIQEQASYYENKYHGCGQSVLLALLQQCELSDHKYVFKAAGFLGAGVARTGNMCGALLGSMIAFGLVAGREDIKAPMFAGPIDGKTQLPMSLAIVREFYSRFVDIFGSSICADIQFTLLGKSYNLASSDEYAEFIHNGGYKACSQVVGVCARMSAETILKLKSIES